MRKVNGKYLLFCRHTARKCIWTQKHLVVSPIWSQMLLCVLLVTAMASMYLPVLPTTAATTQATDPMQLKATKHENRPLSWADISNLLRRKKVKLVSRSELRGKLCVLAPGLIDKTRVVWNDRPLSLWQGIGHKIEVHRYGSQEVLLSQTVSKADTITVSVGEALEPGQTYEWVVFIEQSSSPTFVIPFHVMEAQKRKAIASELSKLETKGKSPEAIAVARANYFAQHELWSDVLQEVFSVKNPPAGLTRIKQELAAELCAPQKE